MIPALTARRGSCSTARTQVVEADVRHHDRDALVAFEELDGGRHRLLAHRRHSTTATPLSDRRPDARTRRATRRGRARRRSRHPTRMRRACAAMSPMSTELERLSITISVRFARRSGARMQDRLPVRALVQLGVARQDEHALLVETRAREARSATPTAIGSPCPSEPVEASTPGTRLRSGWPPRIPSQVRKPLELLGGEEAVLARGPRRTRAARDPSRG